MRISNRSFHTFISILAFSASISLILSDDSHAQPRPRVNRPGAVAVASTAGDAVSDLRCASFNLTLECLNRRLQVAEHENAAQVQQITQLTSSLTQALGRITTLQAQLSASQTQLTSVQTQLSLAQSQIAAATLRTSELERKTANIRRFTDRSGRETVAFENTNVSISAGNLGMVGSPGLGNLFIGNGPDTGDTRRSTDSLFVGARNSGSGSTNLVIGLGNTANGREGLIVERSSTTDANSVNSSILGSNDVVSFNNSTVINSDRCSIDGVAIGCSLQTYSRGDQIIIGPHGGSSSAPVVYQTYINDRLY